jgi:hypothetical protein
MHAAGPLRRAELRWEREADCVGGRVVVRAVSGDMPEGGASCQVAVEDFFRPLETYGFERQQQGLKLVAPEVAPAGSGVRIMSLTWSRLSESNR